MELAASQRVVALTADTAAIQNPSTGNVLTYRKVHKPALVPLALATGSDPRRVGDQMPSLQIGSSGHAGALLYGHHVGGMPVGVRIDESNSTSGSERHS
jgi:hypothetical protein